MASAAASSSKRDLAAKDQKAVAFPPQKKPSLAVSSDHHRGILRLLGRRATTQRFNFTSVFPGTQRTEPDWKSQRGELTGHFTVSVEQSVSTNALRVAPNSLISGEITMKADGGASITGDVTPDGCLRVQVPLPKRANGATPTMPAALAPAPIAASAGAPPVQSQNFGPSVNALLAYASKINAQAEKQRRFALPTMTLSADGVDKFLANLGGYLELIGTDDTGATYQLKIYAVIAANMHLPTFVRPMVSWNALVMGTHIRVGSASVVRKLAGSEFVLRNIHSFIKTKPDWDSLTKLVALKLPSFPSSVRSGLTAEGLVMQYRVFLGLKKEYSDWHSSEVAPPPKLMCVSGISLIDEVWHQHIASPHYEDDIQLFTDGHIIEHNATLDESSEMYCTAWRGRMLVSNVWADVAKARQLVEMCWPVPDGYLSDSENESWADDCG